MYRIRQSALRIISCKQFARDAEDFEQVCAEFRGGLWIAIANGATYWKATTLEYI
jgi:hypothetical protein